MRLISHPVLCNYYVTYRCNAKCGFCDIWKRPSPYVSLEKLLVNLIDLKRLGVKVIDFTGGEPLLHQKIDQMLEMAQQMGFITTLTTNTLLYPKLAEKLKGKVDMLHFSLDSAHEEKHNASRGINCYNTLLKSIQVAKDLNERPDILFTVLESNVDEIELVYENICKPNNLLLLLNPIFGYNEVHTGNALSHNTLQKLSAWGKKKNIYLNEAFITLRKDGGNHINDPVCKAGSSTIVISPEDSLVLPCYHLGIDELPIKGKLYDLYHSEKVQKLVALEGRYPQCEGCTINCYMQPSFTVKLNKYWLQALPSTLKYSRLKGTWKRLVFP